MRKKILLLTKSSKRKNNGKEFGFCITGIDENNDFVRLTADKKGDSLTEAEMPYNPLDIIECELTGPFPINCQTENFIVDIQSLKYIDKKPKEFIFELYEQGKFKRNSFFGSISDRLQKDIALNLGYSLSAIMVTDLHIYRDENNKYKADFYIGNNKVNCIAMTDPAYYYVSDVNPVFLKKVILIVSLPNNAVFNKFIAKIFLIE